MGIGLLEKYFRGRISKTQCLICSCVTVESWGNGILCFGHTKVFDAVEYPYNEVQ